MRQSFFPVNIKTARERHFFEKLYLNFLAFSVNFWQVQERGDAFTGICWPFSRALSEIHGHHFLKMFTDTFCMSQVLFPQKFRILYVFWNFSQVHGHFFWNMITGTDCLRVLFCVRTSQATCFESSRAKSHFQGHLSSFMWENAVMSFNLINLFDQTANLTLSLNNLLYK